MTDTTTGTTTEANPDPSFSAALRAVTWGDHQKAEGAPFMQAIMRGTAGRADYAQLVAQHYFAYVELEAAADAMSNDPVVAPFVFDELTRVPSLRDDLAYLLGDDWESQVAPTEATAAYCDRLREVGANWPGGWVAHHYTRYLGDLSGGQYVGRAVEKIFDLPDHQGASFYQFTQIDDPTAFKDAYRGLLDAAAWSADEQARIIDEIRVAYELNTRVLVEMPLTDA